MRQLRISILFIFLVALGLIFSNGCVTQSQVKKIVAESNAAMVTPAIDKAGNKQEMEGWQDALAKIDQLIAAYPEQTDLVNHLRLRAAMVLTVNRQDSLANLAWERVDGNLLTERDKALYDNYKTLVWWYYRAPLKGPLAAEEDKTTTGIKKIDTHLKSLETQDIKIFFGTIRAQMALKLLNNRNVGTSEERNDVAVALARDLKLYVDLFTNDDITWVQIEDNKKRVKTHADLKLSSLRNRIWLRDMVVEFKLTAEALLGSDTNGNPVPDWEPAWEPAWIRTY